MVKHEIRILNAKVMHKRLFPRVNGFTYGAYYFAVPLSRWGESRQSRLFDFNRFALLSLYTKDYGAQDGTHPETWMRGILHKYGLEKADGEIILVAMPRVVGYAFNPVSFWMCCDKAGALRAVLCEVNNTFGERHCYLCAHPDGRVIQPEDVMTGEKLFHVSPFLEREGSYSFRFRFDGNAFGAWIDFYDAENRKKLLTSLLGKTVEVSPKTCRRAFLQYPLVTLKVIALIHYQAVKLFLKKIKYIPKPEQLPQRLSATEGVNTENGEEDAEKIRHG